MHAPQLARRVTLLASALVVVTGPIASDVGSEGCGPCHGRGTGGIWDEWAESAEAEPDGGRACTTCHVPTSLPLPCGGSGTGSAATLQSLRAAAVTVQVRARWSDGVLEVEAAVCNVGGGHRFPASGAPLELRLLVAAAGRPALRKAARAPAPTARRAISTLLPLGTAVQSFEVPWPGAQPRVVEDAVAHPGQPDRLLSSTRLSTGDWSSTHAGASAWVAARASDVDLQRRATAKGE